jgi:hypothetical protein
MRAFSQGRTAHVVWPSKRKAASASDQCVVPITVTTKTMTTQERQLLDSGTYVDFTRGPMVQDEPPCISPDVPLAPVLVGGPLETSANVVTEEDNAMMQVWWNRAMCDEMKIPDGYQNVAVLIIKWKEELDQLKSGKEVSKPLMTGPFL